LCLRLLVNLFLNISRWLALFLRILFGCFCVFNLYFAPNTLSSSLFRSLSFQDFLSLSLPRCERVTQSSELRLNARMLLLSVGVAAVSWCCCRRCCCCCRLPTTCCLENVDGNVLQLFLFREIVCLLTFMDDFSAAPNYFICCSSITPCNIMKKKMKAENASISCWHRLKY